MKQVGISTLADGTDVEVTATFPDRFRACMDTNDARASIARLINDEAERIGQILTVAERDHTSAPAESARVRAAMQDQKRGPDQVLGAGSPAGTKATVLKK